MEAGGSNRKIRIQYRRGGPHYHVLDARPLLENHYVGVEAGVEAGVEPGVEPGVDVGVEAGVDVGVEAGVEACVEACVEAARHRLRQDSSDSKIRKECVPNVKKTLRPTHVYLCTSIRAIVQCRGHQTFCQSQRLLG